MPGATRMHSIIINSIICARPVVLGFFIGVIAVIFGVSLNVMCMQKFRIPYGCQIYIYFASKLKLENI